MKKLIYALCAVVMVALSGCSKYDDGPLTDRVDNLEKRVITLEELCKQMNTNVSSLQTLVSAVQNKDFITSVNPVSEDGEVVGYTFDFDKSPSITIYHGKDGQNGTDGKDGATPVVGVKKDADGRYYWTLNGEWLLDSDGNKILAEGTNGQDGQNGENGENGQDGKDGATPQFKIDNGDWYISLDNGETWENLGRATGADGQNGTDGDTMFSDIDTSNPDVVTFTLTDGTEFTLPRNPELAITFDEEELIAMLPNSTRTIGYTITGSVADLHVEVLSSGNVRAKINDNTSAKGTLTVTTGSSIDEYDRVVVLVSNGQRTIMSSISFTEKDCLTVKGSTTYEVSFIGGTIDLNVETNMEYALSIPTDAKNWINVGGSRAVRNETITLNIAPNETDGHSRTATLQLADTSGALTVEIQITQTGPADIEIPSDMDEAFPNAEFQEYVLSNFDTDGDGVLSVEEALKVTKIEIIGTQISTASAKARMSRAADGETTLDGLGYFPNLKELKCRNMQLTSLDVSGNPALEVLRCAENQLKELDVSQNSLLTTLECFLNQLTNLDLSNNAELTTLNCNANQITGINISKCPKLYELNCDSNKLISLDVSNNTELGLISCIDNQLTNLDVAKCVRLQVLCCTNNQLTTLDVTALSDLWSLWCNGNQLTSLDLSKSSDVALLSCAMPTLKTLYLKTGKRINGITGENRNTQHILDTTEIVFVD